ncbi:hypothetical protein [Marinobacter salarius]|jgi:hypothetical protein|uniref:hypothetical protein n=1 Tax=Marinobacter salarius TaxID=1420917 RepID=UPI0018F259BC|nr:hypothetical protein [Marinobacter salarius]MBJ7275656.1 hypothetical protein [Marinobacter salarius]
MSYPKVSPWPFIDPDAPPENYLEVGRSVDKARSKTSRKDWRFFVTQGYLIIVRKEWIQFDDDEEGEFAIGQYEYPIAGARWFVNTVERFFLPPDHPDAVPRDKFNMRGEVNGETLGVTRGAWFGGPYMPGYSFDNLNRIEHSTVLPKGATCQMFKMGDPWLFEDGLFDLFKEIADRHEKGEF